MNRHFIIGGAQRSATTYLYQVLDSHPQIQMAKPTRPEPKFFLKEADYSKGYTEYFSRYFQSKNCSPELVLGEKSTTYIEYKDAAIRIKKMLPSAEILFVLRDPIKRAISNVNFSRMHGFESHPIDEALLRELDQPDQVLGKAGLSTSPQSYLWRSSYADMLGPWYDIFDPQKITLITSENVVGNLSTLQKVFSKLKVDNDFIPKGLTDVVNQSDKPSARGPSPETYRRLSDYFAPKNQLLERLYNLDISSWKT